MAEPKSKKKLLFILIPTIVLLLAGGAGAAIFFGLINIPGLNFANKVVKKEDKKPPAKKAPVATPAKVPATKVEKPIPPKPDPAKGYAKLATVWDAMEPEKLKEVVSTWRDDDLAQVLVKMDEEKVSALLALMDPKKSSTIMKAIQVKASEPELVPAKKV